MHASTQHSPETDHLDAETDALRDCGAALHQIAQRLPGESPGRFFIERIGSEFHASADRRDGGTD